MSAAARRDPLETIALGVLCVALLFLAVHDLAILLFPYDLIYGEGFVLRDAAMLRAGRSPYTPLAGLPAVVANYPPLYPAVSALLMIPFGGGFFAGRLVSILATAGAALLLARIARRETGGSRAALFAALLFLADLVVYYWSPYARVDMLALFLEIAALDAFHEALAGKGSPGSGGAPGPADAGESSAAAAGGGAAAPRGAALARGALFGLLAFTTRPTMLAAVGALAAVLIAARAWKPLARAAALVAVPALLAVVALSAATRGEFLRHTLSYNANAFDWAHLPRQLADFGMVHAPLFLGAAAALLAGPLGAGARLLASYALFGLAAAALIGKVGSSANYYLQAVAGASLLFGIALVRHQGAARRVLLLAAIAAPLAATTVPWVSQLELRLNPFAAMGKTPTARDRAVGAEIDRIVRETRGEVLMDEAGYLARAGRTVWAHPLVLRYLEEEKRYDPAPLVEMIRRREFGAIVLTYNFFSPAVRSAIAQNYVVERTIEVPERPRVVVLRPAG